MDHATVTGDFFLNTRAVFDAGKRLRSYLDSDQKLRFAVEQLEQAAQQYESGSAAFRSFMFSELNMATDDRLAVSERATEDSLAGVLTDLQIANVLMSAGQATGELKTATDTQQEMLDQSLSHLQNTIQALDSPLSSPLREAPVPGRRFAFDSAQDAATESVESQSLPSAVDNFKNCFDKTSQLIVREAERVVMNVVNSLSRLDPAKVTDALAKLGEAVGELPKVGRLFNQGVSILQRALDGLRQLLDLSALKPIKDRVEKLWADFKSGKFTSGALEWIFDLETSRAQRDEMLRHEGLKVEALDAGGNALLKLGITFQETMTILNRSASAVSIAGTLLLMVPLFGPKLILLAASIYLLILAAVIVIGMDYSDAGPVFKRVRGLREITSGVIE